MAKRNSTGSHDEPANLDLERVALNKLVLTSDHLEQAKMLELLNEDCFALPIHRQLFAKSVSLYSNGRGITPESVFLATQSVKLRADLEEEWGNAFFDSVYLTHSMSTVNLCLILRDYGLRRATIRACKEVISISASEAAEDAFAGLDLMAAKARDLQPEIYREGSAETMAEGIFNDIIKRQNMERSASPQTGLTAIDNYSLLMPGSLVVVGGRPSMGKTAFALGIAKRIADRGRRCLYYSFEMGHDQLFSRILSDLSAIPYQKMGIPKALSADERQRLFQAATVLKQLPIAVNCSSRKLDALLADIQRQHEKAALGIVLIDYLQLIKAGKHLSANDYRIHIVDCTRELKNIATHLNIPIVLLSQLNREVEKRGSKEPQLSDLRESGSIEEDADVVAFLYRESYYDETKDDKLLQLNVEKNRHGQRGKIPIEINLPINRIDNWSGNITNEIPF